MSVPASARLLPVSFINNSHVGQKLRLFGTLWLPKKDQPSQSAVLCSSKTREGHRGILVDLSVCLEEINETYSRLLMESGSVVMVMGTLEHNSVRL